MPPLWPRQAAGLGSSIPDPFLQTLQLGSELAGLRLRRTSCKRAEVTSSSAPEGRSRRQDMVALSHCYTTLEAGITLRTNLALRRRKLSHHSGKFGGALGRLAGSCAAGIPALQASLECSPQLDIRTGIASDLGVLRDQVFKGHDGRDYVLAR